MSNTSLVFLRDINDVPANFTPIIDIEGIKTTLRAEDSLRVAKLVHAEKDNFLSGKRLNNEKSLLDAFIMPQKRFRLSDICGSLSLSLSEK